MLCSKKSGSLLPWLCGGEGPGVKGAQPSVKQRIAKKDNMSKAPVPQPLPPKPSEGSQKSQVNRFVEPSYFHQFRDGMGHERILKLVLAVTFILLLAPVLSAPAQDNPLAAESQATLVEVLRSDADTFQKAKACQRLAIIGDDGCTDDLVELLGDSKLNVYALTALQRIPGERVDAALVNALQSHEGNTRVGIIDAIGERKIESAEEQLAGLCKSDSVTSAEKHAAIRALGSLGRIDQVRTITSDDELVQRIANDAVLRAASMPKSVTRQSLSQVSDEAFRDALATLQVESSRPMLATSLMASLGELPPPRQVVAMAALAEIGATVIAGGESASLEPVVKLTASENIEVATAAVQLLVAWDHFAQATALPAWVDDRADLVDVALPLLSQAHNDALDRDVVARLNITKSGITDEQVLGLIGYAAERRLSEATPALLRLGRSSNKEISSAAIAAAGYTASINQFAELLELLVDQSNPAQEQADVDLCMSRACVRLPRDQAAKVIENQLPSVSDESKLWLIGSLSQIGGGGALAVVTRAAESSDDTMVDGATRALGEWLSADVAVPLEGLAARLPQGKYRTRALRAYLRVGRQFDMPSDERLRLCRRGLELAERDDERLLVVDILSRNPSHESAKLLAEILSTADVSNTNLRKRTTAALTAVTEKIGASEPK